MPGLKLKRRTGQAVQIGPEVTITVIAIEANAITIDIQAPMQWRIVRTELKPEGPGQHERIGGAEPH